MEPRSQRVHDRWLQHSQRWLGEEDFQLMVTGNSGKVCTFLQSLHFSHQWP